MRGPSRMYGYKSPESLVKEALKFYQAYHAMVDLLNQSDLRIIFVVYSY